MASSSEYTEWKFEVLLTQGLDRYKDPTGMYISAPDYPQQVIGRVTSAVREGTAVWRCQWTVVQGKFQDDDPRIIKEWLKDAEDVGGVKPIFALLREALDSQSSPPIFTNVGLATSKAFTGSLFYVTTLETNTYDRVTAVHSAKPITREQVVELLKL